MILRIDHWSNGDIRAVQAFPSNTCAVQLRECSKTVTSSQRRSSRGRNISKVALLVVCFTVATVMVIMGFIWITVGVSVPFCPLYAAASNATSAPPATGNTTANYSSSANYSISFNHTSENDDGPSLTLSGQITPARQGTRSGTFSLVEKTPTTYTRDIPKTASNPLTLTSELTITVRLTFTPTTYTHVLKLPTPQGNTTSITIRLRVVIPKAVSSVDHSSKSSARWQ